jgi:ABC-type phosphate transport system substrate-binding protein
MKKRNKMFKTTGNILLRIVAVFAASGLGVIGAGSIAGISVMKAVTVAGLTAVAAVVEKLARGFMNDGKLSLDEINSAFAAVDVNSKTAADLQVEANQSGTAITIAPTEAPTGKPDGQVPEEQPVDEDWDKD